MAHKTYTAYTDYTPEEVAKITKRYNGIMEAVGYEHSTIGTQWSEDTEGWGVSEMIGECEYIYSCYYEPGNSNSYSEMREDMGAEGVAMWKSGRGKLDRFIKAYKVGNKPNPWR